MLGEDVAAAAGKRGRVIVGFFGAVVECEYEGGAKEAEQVGVECRAEEVPPFHVHP